MSAFDKKRNFSWRAPSDQLTCVAEVSVSDDRSGMIVVVEGISASGKTSWCAKHAAGKIVPENGRLRGVPDRLSDPRGAADFWAERNVARWQGALAIETASSVAVCDTDPLKLHYTWSLWRIGAATEREWLLELTATRATFAKGLIGFADRYLIADVEPRVAEERALGEPTRRRRNFELHSRLQPALLDWYSALDAAAPGRVQFGLPDGLPDLTSLGERYDLGAFDWMIQSLPRG